MPNAQSLAGIGDWCGRLTEAGFSHGIFILLNLGGIAPLEVFGEKIIPAVQAL
jgi:hypothetical protein